MPGCRLNSKLVMPEPQVQLPDFGATASGYRPSDRTLANMRYAPGML